ncbi:MAG: hypothetical protein TUN42_04325 [Dehalogenimonas sp.]
MPTKLKFKPWFHIYGNQLLDGWLRARQDGNSEDFSSWVKGEYDCYLEYSKDYEVPYHGICDSPSRIEEILYGNEHDPDKCGCVYLGENMWSCGHIDQLH